ncbi:MAG: hypothetical protein D6802_12670 [Ardenticatenia bacterium]|nr:MAG: hypothetical protein D6802_12670 [Ardenticatenia bacterium]
MRIHKRPWHVFVVSLLAVWMSVWGTACAFTRPVLYDVSVAPAEITPNADGDNDVTVITYHIGKTALVTITFERTDGEAAGERYVWRENALRSPGRYEGWFSGVVNDRMIPNGTYRVIIEATPVDRDGTPTGDPVRAEASLVIRDADTQMPEILNLDVSPRVFTPNRDGIDDRVTISYWLAKDVDRLEVYLLGPDGETYPVPEDKIHEPKAAGPHIHDYDGGVDLGAEPPPDGEYTVVVEAQDRVGNRVVATDTLRIEQGGVPRVAITRHDVIFNTDAVVLGETIFFTTTVTNIGNVPVRTHGPEPGTIYTTRENYNNKNEPISDGSFRLGLDFEGNLTHNGRAYPFRWQLGRDDELYIDPITGEKYLMPGQTVTVWGGLTILDLPPREEPAFWIGLIHENVEVVENRIGNTYIRVSAPITETESQTP